MTTTLLSLIVALALVVGVFMGVRQLYLRRGHPVSIGFLTVYLLTTLLVVAYLILTSPGVLPADVAQQASAWFRFAIGIGLALAFLIVLDNLLFKGYMAAELNLHLPGPLRFVILISLLLIVGVILLPTVLKVNLLALVAVPTVLAGVVGIALKQPIAALFEGIILGHVLDPDDWVGIMGIEGRVVNISLHHLKLQTREGDYILIPNYVAGHERIVNFGKPRHAHRCEVAIQASFHDQPVHVLEVMARTAASVPGVLPDPAADAVARGYRESGIEYGARFWIEDYEKRPQMESLVMAYLWQAFQREGIEIPYPVRTVRRPRPERITHEQWLAATRAALGRVDFLAGLSPEELDRLAESVEERVYLPGEAVVREGARGEEFFYITQGGASVTVSGSLQPVATLGPGKYFGEMSLLTGQPRSATVMASQELHVLVVHPEIMRTLLHKNPALADQFGAAIAQRRKEQVQAKEAGAQVDETEEAKAQTLGDSIRRFLGYA